MNIRGLQPGPEVDVVDKQHGRALPRRFQCYPADSQNQPGPRQMRIQLGAVAEHVYRLAAQPSIGSAGLAAYGAKARAVARDRQLTPRHASHHSRPRLTDQHSEGACMKPVDAAGIEHAQSRACRGLDSRGNKSVRYHHRTLGQSGVHPPDPGDPGLGRYEEAGDRLSNPGQVEVPIHPRMKRGNKRCGRLAAGEGADNGRLPLVSVDNIDPLGIDQSPYGGDGERPQRGREPKLPETHERCEVAHPATPAGGNGHPMAPPNEGVGEIDDVVFGTTVVEPAYQQ